MDDEMQSSSPRTYPAEELPGEMYEFRVKGCMDRDFWVDWFGGMQFSVDIERGETTLRGRIIDQAELFGMLSRLRNAGLILISVQRVA